jgi:hypothetical protein
VTIIAAATRLTWGCCIVSLEQDGHAFRAFVPVLGRDIQIPHDDVYYPREMDPSFRPAGEWEGGGLPTGAVDDTDIWGLGLLPDVGGGADGPGPGDAAETPARDVGDVLEGAGRSDPQRGRKRRRATAAPRRAPSGSPEGSRAPYKRTRAPEGSRASSKRKQAPEGSRAPSTRTRAAPIRAAAAAHTAVPPSKAPPPERGGAGGAEGAAAAPAGALLLLLPATPEQSSDPGGRGYADPAELSDCYPPVASRGRGRAKVQKASAPGAPKATKPRKKRRNLTKCFNCGAGGTPQWRGGPLGAKTLCNACGVRYKKGLELVPTLAGIAAYEAYVDRVGATVAAAACQ